MEKSGKMTMTFREHVNVGEEDTVRWGWSCEAEGTWWTDWEWLREWKVAAGRRGDAACIISLL